MAVVVQFVVGVVVALWLGLQYDPLTAFAIVGTIVTAVIIAIYAWWSTWPAWSSTCARAGASSACVLHGLIPRAGHRRVRCPPPRLIAVGIRAFDFVSALPYADQPGRPGRGDLVRDRPGLPGGADAPPARALREIGRVFTEEAAVRQSAAAPPKEGPHGRCSATGRTGRSSPGPSAGCRRSAGVRPGSVLELWTEDAFGGRVRGWTIWSRGWSSSRSSTPRPGRSTSRGPSPATPLAIHFVVHRAVAGLGPPRPRIPLFGSLTGTHATALLQEPLEEVVLDLRGRPGPADGHLRGPPRRLLRRRCPLDPMHRHRRGGARRVVRGPLLAGPRRPRRQHGHPRDAGRGPPATWA